MWQSMRLEDAFGLSSEFVGIDNFVELFKQQAYLDSFRVTAVFRCWWPWSAWACRCCLPSWRTA